MKSVKSVFKNMVLDSFKNEKDHNHYIKGHGSVDDVFSRFSIFQEIESKVDSLLDFTTIGCGLDNFWHTENEGILE